MLTEAALSLKNIIETHYPKHKALIKYLDNENLLKNDLSIESPEHILSTDIENFGVTLSKIN